MKRLLEHGAAILFAIAVIVFLSTLAYQLWVVDDVINGLRGGTYVGSKPTWVAVVAAFGTSLGSAALPFLGACLVDRLDRWLATRSGGTR